MRSTWFGCGYNPRNLMERHDVRALTLPAADLAGGAVLRLDVLALLSLLVLVLITRA